MSNLDWWTDYVLGYESEYPRTGLTKKQVDWMRRVYQGFCHFPIYTEARGYVYCGSGFRIQVHHIISQGFAKYVLRLDPDTMGNLVLLCSYHHIGRGYDGTLDFHENYVPVVHPDIAWAFRMYPKMGRRAFAQVFDERRERMAQGLIYHNPDFDEAFRQINQLVMQKHFQNGGDKFP